MPAAMTKVPKAILLRPGNRQCADCKALDPRWASVNLGIFICDACAGIHRNLGTHISQVRSVTLDDWKTEWIEKVHQVGNDRANAYYEHSVPAGERYTGQVDLVGGDTLNPVQGRLLEQWIRAKYQERRFAPEGQPPPCEEVTLPSTTLAPDSKPWPTSAYPCSQNAVTSPWPTSASAAHGNTTANFLPWNTCQNDAMHAEVWPPMESGSDGSSHSAPWPAVSTVDPWRRDQWACAPSPSADVWGSTVEVQLPPEQTAVSSWQAERWPESKPLLGLMGSTDSKKETFVPGAEAPLSPQKSSCVACLGPLVTGLTGRHWHRSLDYKPLVELEQPCDPALHRLSL